MQHLLREGLGGCAEVQTLSGGVVVGVGGGCELVGVDVVEVGASGQEAPEASDGVLDAALLPGAVGITEEGGQAEGLMVELVMLGELCSVVEGEGAAQGLGQGLEQAAQEFDGGLGLSVVGLEEHGQAGGSLVQGQDGLAVAGEQHEVGFPVAGLAAIAGGLGALGDADAVLDEQGGAAALLAAPPSAGLGSGQIVAPAAVVGALHLGVDEPIDGLHADHRAPAGLPLEPADDLLGRPGLSQQVQNPPPQRVIAIEPRAAPASRPGLGLGVGGLVGR